MEEALDLTSDRLLNNNNPYGTVKAKKMCWTEKYSRVQVCKNLSDLFPIETRRWSIAIAFQLCIRVLH